MSSSSIFVIPTAFAGTSREFALQIERELTDLGVIDGYYDERLGWFAAGEHSQLFFSSSYGEVAFEYAIIYGSEPYRMVPDTGIHGFTCPQCNQRIDDVVCETVSDFYDAEENGPPQDMRLIEIQCSNCRSVDRLEVIPCSQETAWTNAYINFVDFEGNLDFDKLRILEDRIGSHFRILYEKF
jgi:hypothetical protein